MSIDPYASPAVNVSPVSRSHEAAITEGVIRQLAGTKPWVRFISVLIFIGVGFMILAALIMLLAGGMMAQASQSNPLLAGGMRAVIAVIYLVLAFLYIYPGIKLWKYASRIGNLMQVASTANLEAALMEQRKFWKFLGVIMLIILILYALAFVGLILVSVTGAMKAQGV